MYHVSTQGIDKHMINVHYYYHYYTPFLFQCDHHRRHWDSDRFLPEWYNWKFRHAVSRLRHRREPHDLPLSQVPLTPFYNVERILGHPQDRSLEVLSDVRKSSVMRHNVQHIFVDRMHCAPGVNTSVQFRMVYIRLEMPVYMRSP